MAVELFDKHKRKIEPGNVLKVFHFVGARRKRHYLYKQAVEYRSHPNAAHGYLKISHLSNPGGALPDKIGDTYYLEAADGRVLSDYEIVQ